MLQYIILNLGTFYAMWADIYRWECVQKSRSASSSRGTIFVFMFVQLITIRSHSNSLTVLHKNKLSLRLFLDTETLFLAEESGFPSLTK